MAKQTLMWTTLPNGGNATASGTLRLSVLLSPRLELTSPSEKKELLSFPEMANWTKKAQELKFTVSFKGANGTVIVPATTSSTLQPDLWEKMFPPTTFVRSHTFDDLSDRFIVSYPYGNLAHSIKGVYQFVAAASPAGFPPSEGLRNLLAPLNRLNTTRTSTREQLASLKKSYEKTRAVPPSSTPNFLADMKLFDLFHTPQVNTVKDPETGKPITKLTPLPKADEWQDRIDFHQMVSALNKHPELMKRLGLLFDIEVKLPSAIGTSGLVWVEVSPSTKSGSDIKPRTRYTTSGGFQAQPRGKSLQNGLLSLGGEEFDVVQMDVDGAAMKLLNFASTLASAQQRKTTDTPQFLGVPALRSGGLSVARAGRAVELAQNFSDSNTNNTQLKTLTMALAAPGANQKTVEEANVIELWAEDLVRGFRIDAREVTTDAEGNAVPGSAPGAWRSLMRRRGDYRFSSTPIVPAISPDEGASQIAVTQSASLPAASKPELYLHEAMFRWAGWSLVAPRPDKALGPDDAPLEGGNNAPPGMDLEVSFKPEPGSLPRLRFGKRYQMRARICDLAGNGPSFKTEGNAGASNANEGFYARFEPVPSPTLVLTKELSDAQTPGESLERIVIRTRNTSPDKDELISPENSVRHVAPPKTSQEMAELHGMFDDGGLNPADYATFADKDGDFDGPERSGRLAPDEQIELPYLPDPLAQNALFLGLPGSKSANFYLDKQTFDGAWPNRQPFRLRVTEDKAGWNASDRVLDVALPKAEIYTVALYSQMKPNDIWKMGVWRWAAEALSSSPEKLASLQKVAQTGLFWMITPPRFLTFVHATLQPLGVAKWNKLQPSRDLGDTFATFEGVLECHGKSTGRVDVLAEWNEPIDNPNDPNNKPDVDKLSGRANAWEMPIHIGNIRIVANTQLPLSDSQGLYGTYKEEDTTLTFGGRGGGRTNPRRHDFGDTKHRLVRYTAKSTTRFREYFPLDVRTEEENLIRLSSPTQLHVPSSSRPDAPRVQYVVPTFRWDKKNSSSTRIAGLRVYLDRPWFSSGDNELLGVVVLNPPQGVFGGGSPDIDFLDSSQWSAANAVASADPAPPLNTTPTFPGIAGEVFQSRIGVANLGAIKPFAAKAAANRATSSTRVNTQSSDEPSVSTNRSVERVSNSIANLAASSSAIANMKAGRAKPIESQKFDSQVAISATNTAMFDTLPEPVLGTPPPPPPIPDALKPYVTQWGMDPIWASAPTRGVPSPQSFPLATAVGTSLSLEELPSQAVAVAGHTPQYDASRGLWYCDIEMNTGLSYFPFVRLALARFQPYSINGAYLSRVVLADFAQLAARRSASWTRSGNSVRLAVSGPHYKGTGDAPVPNEDGRTFSQPLNVGRIEVVVERREGGSDLGWRAVPNASVELEPDAIISNNPIKTWTGEINLPRAQGDDLRLVIKEWEGYRADKPNTTSQDPDWSENWRRAERLVYADVIEL